MMVLLKNKIILLVLILLTINASAFSLFNKEKDKPILFLSNYNPIDDSFKNLEVKQQDVFLRGDRIYYFVYTKAGFRSSFIRYQIIKQDDNAHVGGFTRVRNGVKRVYNKNFYSDYFVLNETGKYALQIFDIEDSHHWITYGHFKVIDE